MTMKDDQFDMPWLSPLLTTPLAHIVVPILLIIAGIVWATSKPDTGLRKIACVGFGGLAALIAIQVLTAVLMPSG